MTATTAYKTQPRPNLVSKGPIAAKGVLIDQTLGVWDLCGQGTPVDGTTGTGAGFAGPGSRYTDVTGAKMYLNSGAGTKASPVWKIVTSA